ncbi:MAG: 15-cis-phytoene synthase [Cryptosporangiaceae bacterium]|nr:15-cis-phytoene synthase [Cryptosporangiaceae bacterium]
MSRWELNAARIGDNSLRASYTLCRRLNAAHGKTYYLATLLLPPAKRPHVHALYGFARYADEIVDDLDTNPSEAIRADRLAAFTARVSTDLAAGHSAHPIVRALIHTMGTWEIPPGYVESFLASMRMDLTIAGYATYDALMEYVYGSAEVVGLQMLPILEHPGIPREQAEPFARNLGVGFQLANFIRDVGEDLRRGRVYLPQEDLDSFGVERSRLARGVVDAPIRRLLRFEIDRARSVLDAASPGIELLHPASRDCVRTAFVLYGGILGEIERRDYQVLTQRVSVGTPRRAAVALPALVRACLARTRFS